MFELGTPHAPRDLDARVLAVARVVASAVGGCPFCIDMNAATWREARFSAPELDGLLNLDRERRESPRPASESPPGTRRRCHGRQSISTRP